MNKTHIETFSYQLSPQYYFNRLLKIWLHNNWGWLLSFFLLLVGLSIQNPLFIYVGLIILFLVFPMIISHLWFAYALHPDCRMSILSKTVEINKNGLSCTFDDGRTESIESPIYVIPRQTLSSTYRTIFFSFYHTIRSNRMTI